MQFVKWVMLVWRTYNSVPLLYFFLIFLIDFWFWMIESEPSNEAQSWPNLSIPFARPSHLLIVHTHPTLINILQHRKPSERWTEVIIFDIVKRGCAAAARKEEVCLRHEGFQPHHIPPEVHRASRTVISESKYDPLHCYQINHNYPKTHLRVRI